MPELPEVETIVRELQASDLIGKKIAGAEILWPKTVSPLDPLVFCKQITGQTIKEITRRGKYIILRLNKDSLFIHLRMTGKLFFIGCHSTPLKHERVRLILSDGRVLAYDDQRKFGRWLLLPNESNFKTLGIEPLTAEFTLPLFQQLLGDRNTQIKPFLLNQSHIAGMGNIYVDEALWEARIHPQRSIKTLSNKEIQRLHKAIPHVLEKGIAHQGTTLGSTQANYFSVSGRRGTNQYKLNVFRREGLPCPYCGEKIIKIRVAQRGTHLCPICQI